MTKILYIDPVYDTSYLDLFKKHLSRYQHPSTELIVESLGFSKGPKHLEYLAYEALIIPDLIKKVINAEKRGFDVAIIGCFYDPAIQAAREVSKNMMVCGPSQAAFSIAQPLGDAISIIVGRDKTTPTIKNNVFNYGMERKFVGFRSLNLGVLEFQEDTLKTQRIIEDNAILAIEQDGADIIILGCTAEFGFHENLQKQLKVPVIDASVASIKYAEFLAEIKRIGWTHSRKGIYEEPSFEEGCAFGLYK